MIPQLCRKTFAIYSKRVGHFSAHFMQKQLHLIMFRYFNRYSADISEAVLSERLSKITRDLIFEVRK